MKSENLIEFVLQFQENDPANRIAADFAKNPEYIGKKMLDGVLLGVAAADDPVIVSLKDNKEANTDLMMPEEWLPGAKSVISFFFPFAHWIAEENAGGDYPSDAWLHARIEGQEAINRISHMLVERIRGEGYEAVSPSIDPRFKVYYRSNDTDGPKYTSNWSERHIAYAAGLGTFSMSRSFITERGCSGRFTSIITNLLLPVSSRKYGGLYENCTFCEACVDVCISNAIPKGGLKDHVPCDAMIKKIMKNEDPYYGCGKCQCGMPCSYGIPGR